MEIGCQSLVRPNAAVNFPSPPALPLSAKFELGTSGFMAGGTIPRTFTCDGPNDSPALAWIGPPSGTESFVLTLQEAKAAEGHSTHWIVYNIPASATGLPEASPPREELGAGARQAVNDLGKTGYSGPCPPSGAPHHYVFKLYALDAKLPPQPGTTAEQDAQAPKAHILAQAEITGTYPREKGPAH
jgi:Raf kinase inhibitor-like YbhB/YbcL family protein